MLGKRGGMLICICLFMMLNACATTVNNSAQGNVAASKANVKLGLAYLARKQIPNAKESLLLAVEESPRSVTALNALAYYWESTGNTKNALADYKKALSIKPNSGRGQNNFGAFLCEQGSYKMAIYYLLKAANNKNYMFTAAAYENAGICSLKAGNKAKAIKYLKHALLEDPARIKSLRLLKRLGVYTQ